MINQIVSNSADKSVFAPLLSNDAGYAIVTPYTEKQKREFEQEKDKKISKLGKRIAVIAGGLGFGLILLSQLFSRKSSINIEKLLAKLSQNKQLNTAQNGYSKVLKGAKYLLKNSQGIFTFANLKDIGVWKGLSLTSPTKKFSEFTTRMFKKVSMATSKSSYKKTSLKFMNMFGEFENINSKIKSPEKLGEIPDLISQLKANYDKGFGVETRLRRLEQIEDAMRGFAEKFWSSTWGDWRNFFRRKDSYTKFFTEELVAAPKAKINDEVEVYRRTITKNSKDNVIALKKVLNEINSHLNTTTESRTLFSETHHILEKYGKTGSKASKRILLEKINQLSKYVHNPEKHGQEVSDLISKGVNILANEQKGNIQEILKSYKELADKNVISPEDYAKIEKTVNKTMKSLDKSIDLEANQLFDKMRDLTLGSAPHDTLAFLSSLGVMGWGVSKADNNDERISVALKYGIPAIGAVAITIMCTVGLIASGPSLLIGFVSGLAINQLGELVDKVRKQYQIGTKK